MQKQLRHRNFEITSVIHVVLSLLLIRVSTFITKSLGKLEVVNSIKCSCILWNRAFMRQRYVIHFYVYFRTNSPGILLFTTETENYMHVEYSEIP